MTKKYTNECKQCRAHQTSRVLGLYDKDGFRWFCSPTCLLQWEEDAEYEERVVQSQETYEEKE